MRKVLGRDSMGLSSAFSLCPFMSSEKQTPKIGSNTMYLLEETPGKDKREWAGGGRESPQTDPGRGDGGKEAWGWESLALLHTIPKRVQPGGWAVLEPR